MKRFVVLFALVAFVVLGWSGAWLFGAKFIDNALATPNSATGTLTAQAQCADTQIAGFPFRFDVTCTELTLVDADITVTIPEIKVTALVYRPTHLLAFVQGPATISDAFTGSESRVAWTNLQASARTNWLKPIRFSLIADSVSVTDTLFNETLLASADHIEAHMVDVEGAPKQDTMNAGIFAQFTNAHIPAIQTKNIDADLDTLITALPNDIRQWLSPSLLRVWQGQEGKALINHVMITAPEVTANMSGELLLNDAGLANGTLQVTSKGLAERMRDILPSPYDTLVFGSPQQDGSYAQNLSLSSGIVRVGFVPLAQLAPLF